MKNVYILDPSLYVIDAVMSFEDVFVPVFVADSNRQKQFLEERYPNRIGNIIFRNPSSYVEFLKIYENDYNISNVDIERYRYAQLKVEHYTQREVLDSAEAQYRYFVALAYFIGVFEKHKIDFIFMTRSEHGGPWDSIPIEIARHKNIPVYVLEGVFGNKTHCSYCIHSLFEGQYVNIENISNKYVVPKVKNYTYKFTPQSDNKHVNIKQNCSESNNKQGKGGYTLGNVPIYTKHFRKDFKKNTTIFDYPGNAYPEEVAQNMRYVEKLSALYDEISERPKEGEKFIFYPLHLEPEANTMNRDSYTSQLFVIKLLSECLPEGWKLYVKEHPYQFYFSPISRHRLRNIFLFRTEQFYRNIIDNKNVRLIDQSIHSLYLQNDSQAVATICGSTIFESMLIKKPVLIFGTSSKIFTMCSDAFKIYSKSDIAKAIETIQSGFVPVYSDLENVISQYTYEVGDDEFNFNEKNNAFMIDIFDYLLKLNEVK